METRLGELIHERRTTMQMSLNTLSQLMGGSPSPSFLHRIEKSGTTPSRDVAIRLSRALQIDSQVVLNASGHTSDEQMSEAQVRLQELIGESAPRMHHVPVMDVLDPGSPTGETRPRMVRGEPEDARIVDLEGAHNEPYTGEVMYSIGKSPSDASGVIVSVDGKLSAWTYMDQGKKQWIENSRGDRRAGGYSIQGVITRIVKSIDLE